MNAGAQDAERGLYDKFIVTRRDGRSAPGEKHEGCEYFVLDLDHDPHALPALEAYRASLLRCNVFPRLADDLGIQIATMKWRERERGER